MGVNGADSIADIFGCHIAKNSIKTYDSSIRSLVNALPESVNFDEVFPVQTVQNLIILMSSQKGNPWSSAKTRLAALSTWHDAKGFHGFTDLRYSKTFLIFWAGMKRCADMSSYAKRAISAKELEKFIDESTSSHKTNSNVRNKAYILFCFYGVRRISEARNLNMQDISIRKDGVQVQINFQKNRLDPMSVLIPFISSTKHCPASAMIDWYNLATANYKHSNFDPLFFNTRGARTGTRLPDCAIRNLFNKHFEKDVGTQSCRKGGAQFWYALSGGNVQLVKSQGGWKSEQVMQQVYLAMHKEELVRTLSSISNNTTTRRAPRRVIRRAPRRVHRRARRARRRIRRAPRRRARTRRPRRGTRISSIQIENFLHVSARTPLSKVPDLFNVNFNSPRIVQLTYLTKTIENFVNRSSSHVSSGRYLLFLSFKIIDVSLSRN